MLAVGMTGDAVGGTEIGAARDQVGLGGTDGRRQEQRGGSEGSYCSFARKVLWHPLQASRSLNAAATLGWSPLFTAASSAATWSATVLSAARNLSRSLQTSGFGPHLPSGLVPPFLVGNNPAPLVEI